MKTDDGSEAVALFEKLENCGWFDDLPKSLAISTLLAMKAAAAENQPSFHGLIVNVCDGIYLLDEKPYSSLCRQFVEASGNLIPLEVFEESRHGDRIHFVFGSPSSRITLDLPARADDLPDTFVRGINQAVTESGSHLQFLELNVGWGPIPAYTLTSITAFNAAVKARLLPDQRRFVPADQEEALASTFAARLAKIVHGS